jgi:hypothetical protein
LVAGIGRVEEFGKLGEKEEKLIADLVKYTKSTPAS